MREYFHDIHKFSQSRHPELHADETFYTNVEKGKDLRKLDLTNRRVGKIAYDWQGKKLPSCVPVFEKV
jgi:hypothetical protein